MGCEDGVTEVLTCRTRGAPLWCQRIVFGLHQLRGPVLDTVLVWPGGLTCEVERAGLRRAADLRNTPSFDMLNVV